MKRARRVRRAAVLALGVAAAAAAAALLTARLTRALKARIADGFAHPPKGVTARAERIDVSVWRRRVVLSGLELGYERREARLSAPRAVIRVSPLSLLRRELVVSATIEKPVLRMPVDWLPPDERRKRREAQAAKAKARGEEMREHEPLAKLMEKAPPLFLTKVSLEDGRLHDSWSAEDAPPAVDEAHLELRGFSTRGKKTARLEGRARVVGSGKAKLELEFEPTSEPLDFRLDFRLDDVDLAAANPFLLRRWGFDVKEGRYDLALELSAKEGRFKGAVSPTARGLAMGRHGPGLKKAAKELYVGKELRERKDAQTGAIGRREEFSGAYGPSERGFRESVFRPAHAAYIRAIKRAMTGPPGG